jgi:hypothetical protein
MVENMKGKSFNLSRLNFGIGARALRVAAPDPPKLCGPLPNRFRTTGEKNIWTSEQTNITTFERVNYDLIMHGT